jgi:hypothetical protein
MRNFTQDYAKISFDIILMEHIQDCGKQLQKLPHEVNDPSLDRPIGQTYFDVVTSYSNLVDHLEALLKPYHDQDYQPQPSPDGSDPREIFIAAKVKFEQLMCLCQRKNFLLQKVVKFADGEGTA